MMVKHVVVTEFILTVELCVSETKKKKKNYSELKMKIKKGHRLSQATASLDPSAVYLRKVGKHAVAPEVCVRATTRCQSACCRLKLVRQEHTLRILHEVNRQKRSATRPQVRKRKISKNTIWSLLKYS